MQNCLPLFVTFNVSKPNYMPVKKQFEEFEKAFYKDGYHLMASCWDAEDPSKSVQSAMKQAYEMMDGFIAELLGHGAKEGKSAECRKGCAWCCSQAVYAGNHELIYLKNYMAEVMSEEDKAKVEELAKTKFNLTQNLSVTQLLTNRHACPLLSNGACSVYAARPMACRIYLSFNELSCQMKYNNKLDANTYPQLMEFPLKAGRMLNEGIISFLKINKITVREWRIEEGLLEELSL